MVSSSSPANTTGYPQYTTPVAERHPAITAAAKFFGLPPDHPLLTPAPAPTALSPAELSAAIPQPGQITLLSGPSGSGKSSLLRSLAAHLRSVGATTVNLDTIAPPDHPVVILFGQVPTTDVLRRLGRVGLGEAQVLFHRPSELSDGQRFRLHLALALHDLERSPPRHPRVLLIDEFCNSLDPVSATVVSTMLSRTVRDLAIAAVVATWRTDLRAALKPACNTHCDFGKTTLTLTPRCHPEPRSEPNRPKPDRPTPDFYQPAAPARG